MQIINLASSPTHFLPQWVRVLSGFLDLTPAEQKALVVILMVSKEEINHHNRKEMAKRLKLTSSGFNNHVMTLARKMVLQRQDDGRYLLHPQVIPDTTGIQFTFHNAGS